MAPVAGLSRTAALPGPPPRPAPAATPAASEDRTPSAPPDSPERTPRKVPERRSEPRSETVGTVRQVALSMPAAVVQAVRDRARRDGISQPEVLMDALVATQERLPDVLPISRKRPALQSDGLFVRREPAPRDEEPLVTLTVRMLTTNVRAIDDLVEQVGAPSRSALCVAALRDYLLT